MLIWFTFEKKKVSQNVKIAVVNANTRKLIYVFLILPTLRGKYM